MATELEILPALPIACLTCAISGSRRYGCRLSFLHRWQTSDVSEYCNVDPTFGALSDFDDLVTAAHNVGIKVIIDFVPNHTSDQHPWFVESRRSRFNSRRDWYVWRDPKPDGSPPNNWLSEFGGPAWTFDHRSGQYYYHAYLKQQPDLNWRNSDVREAMFDVLFG
jgi:alpha-glucosidase